MINKMLHYISFSDVWTTEIRLSEVIISPGLFKLYLMVLKYCSFIYRFSNQAEM